MKKSKSSPAGMTDNLDNDNIIIVAWQQIYEECKPPAWPTDIIQFYKLLTLYNKTLFPLDGPNILNAQQETSDIPTKNMYPMFASRSLRKHLSFQTSFNFSKTSVKPYNYLKELKDLLNRATIMRRCHGFLMCSPVVIKNVRTQK
jgi:hypothetical protein